MIHRSRMVQMGFFLAAAACLIAAGLMLRPLEQASKPADLLTTTDVADFESNPELGLLTAMPGGLRVLAVNYLWIRAQDAHQEGRLADSVAGDEHTDIADAQASVESLLQQSERAPCVHELAIHASTSSNSSSGYLAAPLRI